uniref:Uncharacterized protein n=1 Tax=Cacopsylla melanoneura TaxID=428564 RepID=A0A8D9FCN6_9HEMI
MFTPPDASSLPYLLSFAFSNCLPFYFLSLLLSPPSLFVSVPVSLPLFVSVPVFLPLFVSVPVPLPLFLSVCLCLSLLSLLLSLLLPPPSVHNSLDITTFPFINVEI